MKQFLFCNPTSLAEATDLLGTEPAEAQLLAGGMDLLGRLKKRIDTPKRVVNLKSIPGLATIGETPEGLSLGTLVTLTDVAENPALLAKYRAVAEAAKSVGSVQIRNAGTVGGNLCQRPRCWYFRHRNYVCLQKKGTTCFGRGWRESLPCDPGWRAVLLRTSLGSRARAHRVRRCRARGRPQG